MNIEELKENPIRYIKSFAMDIVVVLVALSYVFYQMVTLEFQDLNPIILIAEAFMGIVCGVVIKQALGENGFSRGYNSDFWKTEEELYNKTCNLANGYMDRVGNFYLCEEIKKRREYRIQHLQAVRLRYDNWFDYDGNYIGDDKEYRNITRKQRRMLEKCIKVKIYVLNLFSEYSNASEQWTKKEMTDKRKKAENLTRNTLSAVVIAVIGVYFAPMMNGWSWASFISATFQVVLWVLFGVLQLYSNYNFVVQDKVSILKQKKEDIVRFTKDCENGLYVQSPYDVNVNIEQQAPSVVS